MVGYSPHAYFGRTLSSVATALIPWECQARIVSPKVNTYGRRRSDASDCRFWGKANRPKGPEAEGLSSWIRAPRFRCEWSIWVFINENPRQGPRRHVTRYIILLLQCLSGNLSASNKVCTLHPLSFAPSLHSSPHLTLIKVVNKGSF